MATLDLSEKICKIEKGAEGEILYGVGKGRINKCFHNKKLGTG